jgi:hypothetical protein
MEGGEMMRVANWRLLAVAVALSTTACGIATTAGADYRPGLDFGIYSTFGWGETAVPRTGDLRLENNPFFEDRLFEAMERELSMRGIRHAESSPELLVHYHLAVMDHIEVFEANPQSGYPTSEYGDGTEVVQYEQGTFVLHFVDAETHEDLWFGWARGDIGPALTNSEKMREWVDEAVALILEDFPLLGNGRGS